MTDTPARDDIVMAFLSCHAGVYQYQLWFRRFMFGCAIMFLLAYPIVIDGLISGEQNSIYVAMKDYLFLVFAPYFIWSFFVVARNFKEVRIDGEGISILPFGLHIESDDIEKIRRGENYAGADTIELELKSPYRLFHVIAWSWGAKVTISFNTKILKRISVSA